MACDLIFYIFAKELPDFPNILSILFFLLPAINKTVFNMTINFNIKYHTQWGEAIGVSISQGSNAAVNVYLSTEDGVMWSGNAEISGTSSEVVAYRYYVSRDNRCVRKEIGTMPHILFPQKGINMYERSDCWYDSRRIAGVAIPVFSLVSEGSSGVGDFGDLKTLIDWAEKTGMNAIQILPINDTTVSHTWSDSYPYNSISIYALHLMYLDLRQLDKVNDEKEMAKFEKERKKLNALRQMDYEAVNELKRYYVRKIYGQEGDKVLFSAAFKIFYKKNEEWLKPYAAFSFLRELYGTSEFAKWPEHSKYIASEIDNIISNNKDEINYYYYVQYNLHIQLLEVGNYARRKNIILKGDIPIGISRNSVEAWVEPFYFNMNGQTGAPPDAFSDDGQNWGFPTYNWDVMAKDGYKWWLRRMRKMAEYFSAYRIDHILGFFRIWEIPMPYKSGLMGHFSPALPMSREDIESWGVPFVEDMYLKDLKDPLRYHLRISAKKEDSYKAFSPDERCAFDRLFEYFFYHRHNQFWYEEAMKKLPVLTRSTQMIVCGEDLGMVPECVHWVMNELGILSLEIQSMSKNMWHEFGVLQEYPALSVCTISSHDTPTLRGWWEEDIDRAQRFYNNALKIYGKAPEKAPGWLCEKIVRQHLECPSILCILALQDWFSVDEIIRYPEASEERINVPSDSHNYWRYRMHITLEDLMNNTAFNEKILGIIKETRG